MESEKLGTDLWTRAATVKFLQEVALFSGYCYDPKRMGVEDWNAWLTPALLRAPAPVVVDVYEGEDPKAAFGALFEQAPADHYVLLVVEQRWEPLKGKKAPATVLGAYKTTDGKRLRDLLPRPRPVRKAKPPTAAKVYRIELETSGDKAD